MTAFSTAMAASNRTLHIRGTLTLLTGYAFSLTDDDILQYTLHEGVSGGSMLLGSAISAHGSLTLHNPEGAWQPGGSKLGNRTLPGAAAALEIGVETANGVIYEPAGCFIISSVEASEGENIVTLSGYDPLLHRFAAKFNDTGTYPCTLGAILSAVAAQAGCTITGTPLCNEHVVIHQKPDWGENCSLRHALAWIAGAMGCFVQLSRAGMPVLCPVHPQTDPRALGPDTLQSLSVAPGAFLFNRLRVYPLGAQTGEYVEKALKDALPSGADNLLTIEDNPIFRAGTDELPALVQNLCQALSGLTFTPFEAEFPGDPALRVGDGVTLTDLRGHTHPGLVFSQQLTFGDGLSSYIACDMQTDGIQVPRVITTGGTLSSAALTDGVIVSRHLAAGSVDAEKISARTITAEHIALKTLTSDSGVLGDLSANDITSGKLNTDRLIVGGTEFSIVRALNQLANSLSQNDDSIDGDILSDHSISAVKVTDDFGAGLELSSNAAVLLLAGKLDGTHSHMELTESAVNMVGGEINIATNDLEIRGMDDGGEIMSLDPEGLSANRVVVREEFSAPNVMLMHRSSSLPWRGSIQSSLDGCAKYLVCHTVLSIPAGVYRENVTISGFQGAALEISLAAGVTIEGAVTIENCANVTLSAAALGEGKIYPPDAALNTINAKNVGSLTLSNLQISGYRGRSTAADGTGTGVNAISCRMLMVNCCVEYTGEYAILARQGTTGFLNSCFGGQSGSDPAANGNLGYGVFASEGCHIGVYNTLPMGAAGAVGSWLSTVLHDDAAPTAGGMEYTAPSEYTRSFAITKHCTYLYGVSRLRDDQSAQLSQGRYGAYESGGLGWRIGAMWFGGAAALYGRTIKSATLTLRRATGGWSNAVPVYLGSVNLTEDDFASTLTPAFTAASAYPMASLSRETEGVFDVTELMGVLASGGALGVFEPRAEYSGSWSPAYTNFYGKGSGYEPVLTVTYT